MNDKQDLREFLGLFHAAKLWPDDVPHWQWIEREVWLDPTMSDLSGRVKFDLFPASKYFLSHLDSPRVRKVTVLKCAQSGFTENAIMYLLRRIRENPITTMWVGANATKTEEDAKKRIWPAIENCPAVKPLCPPPEDRERWTKRLIMFDTMNLMIRGSESRMSVQGDPAGLIICDERREWKPGRIHLLRKRTRTKVHPLEISIGAAGIKGDELHTDWLEGSQTFLHFTCPECNRDQPWRFGRRETVLFPDPRPQGGVVWADDEKTKPGGIWNYDAVRTSARYECEGCGHRFEPGDKWRLLKTTTEHHRNPMALPANYSLYVNALILPFAETTWGDIAVEFLRATEATSFGDIEPLKAFVTETDGQPWEVRNAKHKEGELLDRCGTYSLGDFWPDPKNPNEAEPGTVLLVTFDRQMTYLAYVIRQWRKNGESRLVWCGQVASYDDLRKMTEEKKIRARWIWGDDGGLMTAEFRQTALRHGWGVLKGDDASHFTIYDKRQPDKSYRQGWKQVAFDPGIGTSSMGRVTIPAFMWSNDWYKDKLYNIFLCGKGPLWEIAKDVPHAYTAQVMANEWREKTRANGQVEGYWHETGADHYADCELEQLVVADLGGFTRSIPHAAL